MGTLHDMEDEEVVQPGTAGHPDLWTRWCVPRGCLMLVSSCQGWEELSHPMGKGCAGVLEQRGSQLPWEGGVIWGVVEPPLWGQSVLEAGE